MKNKFLLSVLLNLLFFSSSALNTNSFASVQQNAALLGVSQFSLPFSRNTTADESRFIFVTLLIVILVAIIAGYAIYLMNRKMHFADYFTDYI